MTWLKSLIERYPPPPSCKRHKDASQPEMLPDRPLVSHHPVPRRVHKWQRIEGSIAFLRSALALDEVSAVDWIFNPAHSVQRQRDVFESPATGMRITTAASSDCNPPNKFPTQLVFDGKKAE